MSLPTGEQYVLAADNYRAVVTQSGVLRELSHDGRALIDGFPEDDMPSGGRGQLLMPWPNRIRDGSYSFEGRRHQLALSEPARANASHGLVRWVSWTAREVATSRVVLSYFLPAQTGYPWPLDLRVTYELGADGLRVTQAATNRGGTRAPYASGAHPYLQAGEGPCDTWRIELPAETVLHTDPERLLPLRRGPVADLGLAPEHVAVVGDRILDHSVTDLRRTEDGLAVTRLWAADGAGVELWVDGHHRWLQVYTGDGTARARASIAVEPMTAPPDAFNSGEDLARLDPGETCAVSWGVRALQP